MSEPKLTLELLGGPLDGLTLTLEAETEWSKTGDGPLSFPWDNELGTPQARLFTEAGEWRLEALPNERSTRHNMEPIDGTVLLNTGDLLKAANSWLLVTNLDSQNQEQSQ